jgi:hypothetical protein
VRGVLVALGLLAFLAGCGGEEKITPDKAESVLSDADNRRVEGALERIYAWCNGDLSSDSQAVADRAYDELTSIAQEQPHSIYNSAGGDPQTMVQGAYGRPPFAGAKRQRPVSDSGLGGRCSGGSRLGRLRHR